MTAIRIPKRAPIERNWKDPDLLEALLGFSGMEREMEEKHTPTPWYVTERGKECHISNSPTVDENGDLPGDCYWIAITMGSATDSGDDNANADFIVRAVNLHAELVEALDLAQKTLSMLTTNTNSDTTSMAAWATCVAAETKARAALSKAKAEP